MDFFVDGGLQQLFSDLDESEIELTKSPITITCNAVEDHYHYHYQSLLPQEDVKFSQSILNDIQMYDDPMTTDELLQENLDFLLSAAFTQNAAEDCTNFSDLYLMNTELSDWEDKFLDNFIEIPELSRILPDETPLCTENCVKFLQESSENLRLLYSNQQQKKPDFNIKDTNRIYTCHFGECRKIYAKSAHLKAHLRRHLGDKPFVCTWPQCNWKFSRSDELARHKRSHSGIKPYCCDFCNKCFARSDHLTKHRKVHEKRLLAASRAGKTLNGVLPPSILTIRPGRKKKNQL